MSDKNRTSIIMINRRINFGNLRFFNALITKDIRGVPLMCQADENFERGTARPSYLDSKTVDRLVTILATLGLCRRETLWRRKEALRSACSEASPTVEERLEFVMLPHLSPDHPVVVAAAVNRRTACSGVGANTPV